MHFPRVLAAAALAAVASAFPTTTASSTSGASSFATPTTLSTPFSWPTPTEGRFGYTASMDPPYHCEESRISISTRDPFNALMCSYDPSNYPATPTISASSSPSASASELPATTSDESSSPTASASASASITAPSSTSKLPDLPTPTTGTFWYSGTLDPPYHCQSNTHMVQAEGWAPFGVVECSYKTSSQVSATPNPSASTTDASSSPITSASASASPSASSSSETSEPFMRRAAVSTAASTLTTQRRARLAVEPAAFTNTRDALMQMPKKQHQANN